MTAAALPADGFTCRPLVGASVALCVSLLLLISSGLVFTSLFVLATLGTFAVSWLRHLVALRLDRLASASAGTALFLIGIFALVRWGDQVHFWIMRPVYDRAATALPSNERQSRLHWGWDGGLGSDVSLYYRDTPPPEAQDGEAGCTVRWQHMDAKFYVGRMECNGVPSWRDGK